MRVLLSTYGSRGDVEPMGIVVQTGAWILPDERPLPVRLAAFLDAGTPPVYVGFGGMPMRAQKDIARVAIEAIEAIRARATAVAGTIRTDGTTMAASLLLDAISRERPPVPA